MIAGWVIYKGLLIPFFFFFVNSLLTDAFSRPDNSTAAVVLVGFPDATTTVCSQLLHDLMFW